MENYLSNLTDFLLSPLPASLLAVHPNEAALDVFPGWDNWWNWAAVDRNPLQALLDQYLSMNDLDVVPADLRGMIDTIKTWQLVRAQGHHVVPSCSATVEPPSPWPHGSEILSPGMSPKKSHEVASMVSFITELLGSSDDMRNIKHVVDVGAGQGYLSRALQATGLHVLALDSSDVQAQGAERRQAKSSAAQMAGSLTYRTTDITSQTLISSIGEWVATLGSLEEPVPIMVVALHACGSLTPDILRASLQPQSLRKWVLRSAVVVGCCYNLMSPQDYPLSNSRAQPLQLTSSHLQLAAQVPSTWLDPSSHTLSQKAMGGVQKVAYRAMLEKVLHKYPTNPKETRRLGKLNDKAYVDWKTFLTSASTRLQIGPLESAHDEVMERRLSTLHVLRCLLGPCIESLIIWDRYMWVMEVLKEQRMDMNVELVNLFDQNSGSGRNVAIILKSR